MLAKVARLPWRHRPPAAVGVAGCVVAAAIGLSASGVLGHVPSSQAQSAALFDDLAAWTYLFAAALAFAEVGTFIGLIAPTELVVPLAGAAAAQGSLSLPLVIFIVWVGAVAGESLSYLLGRKLGREFLLRHGRLVRLTEARISAVEAHFRRFGGWTVLTGRFMAYVRTATPFLAGAARMSYGRFLAWSITGCGVWSATLALLGYTFFGQIDTVIDLVLVVSLGLAGALALAWLLRIAKSLSRSSGP